MLDGYGSDDRPQAQWCRGSTARPFLSVSKAPVPVRHWAPVALPARKERADHVPNVVGDHLAFTHAIQPTAHGARLGLVTHPRLVLGSSSFRQCPLSIGEIGAETPEEQDGGRAESDAQADPDAIPSPVQ